MKRYKTLNSKGFTLSEVLVCILLLLILGGLLTPPLLHFRRSLRQTELDDKAETIYMTVQNRLTQLYVSGNQSLYDPSIQDDLISLSYIPEDYTAGTDYIIDEGGIYAMRKGDSSADVIVTSDVLDSSLNGEHSHWVIELVLSSDADIHNAGRDTSAPTVYAVYYSEGEIDVSLSYSTSDPYRNTYRVKGNRIKAGAHTGYYGGSHRSSSSASPEAEQEI